MSKPGIARTARHATLCALPALLLVLASLGFNWPMPAAPASAGQLVSSQSDVDDLESEDDATGTEDAESGAYPVGIFVTSLHDLNTSEGSFGVDYWVWSVHPPEVAPLENLEYYNAEETEASLDLTEERGDRSWSQRKIGAVVRHDWDLRNFPFDHQVLDIVLEEGSSDTSTIVYSADATNSGYNEDIRLEGWRITDFAVEERTVDYATTFGDPAISGGSNYSRLVASIEIQRESVTGFFKLVAGVYAASALAILSFLMTPSVPPIFSGRMVVLVGALFSTVLSLRASEAVLGSTEGLSLVDKIHIVAMVYIFAAALIGLLARKTFESGKEELAERRDRTWLYLFSISFVLVNGLLIAMAAIVG